MRACNVEEGANHGAGDSWEVFTQLVILIIEGRVPGGEKGFHAGPHCSSPHQTGISRHVCDPSSSMCARVESLLRQLRLMWGVGVGVSVEVLVAPECEHGAAFTATLDTTPAPSPQLRLIEQWNFTIYNRNLPDAMPSGWSLVAAVRSFLHFSQLSAWLSVSGGARPPNVLYRLTVTSPVFCSKFEAGSEEHTFPVANVGQETAIKVVVRSLPRSNQAPVVNCLEVHQESEPTSSYISLPSTSHSVLSDSSPNSQCQQNINKIDGNCTKAEEDLRRSMMRARLGDPTRVSRSESPDTQLGESLLDPPNSLSRIPRRFQSPSRSGSPSLETPEHIICRVRQPGPSHGRPPDPPSFCQPLIIPARQPLNSFAWTQTRFPSVQQSQQTTPYPHHHHHPFHPPTDIFHAPRVPPETVHSNPAFSPNIIPYAAFPPNSNPPCFYGSNSQLLWTGTENVPLLDKYPVNLPHYFQVMHAPSAPLIEEELRVCPDQGQSHPKFFQEVQNHQDYQQSQRGQSSQLQLQSGEHQEHFYQQGQPMHNSFKQQIAGVNNQLRTQLRSEQQESNLKNDKEQQPNHIMMHQVISKSKNLNIKSEKDTMEDIKNQVPLLKREQSQLSSGHQHNKKTELQKDGAISSERNLQSNSHPNENYMIQFAKPPPAVSSKSNSYDPLAEDSADKNGASSSCNADIINVLNRSEDIQGVTILSPSKTREAQGTKRKGAHNKESPRTKRESPPHIYYSREGKEEEKVRESDEKREDFRKRKQSVEEVVDERKNCSKMGGMLNYQKWPTSCLQSGKHLCSSVEDLADISGRDQSIVPITKSFRKEKSLKAFDSCSTKVSFDLTPKETQEVLRVLRQNTPVPPLRIDQHKIGPQTSVVETCIISKTGRLEPEKASDCLELLGKSEANTDSVLAKDISSKNKSKSLGKGKELKYPRHYIPKVKGGLECKGKQDIHPTSSNKSCDTSFKKPINCTCDRKLEGEVDDDSDDYLDYPGEVLDGLSLGEFENVIERLKPESSCIEAKTVTQKTNYFMVNSQPTSTTNSMRKQTSQALSKSPLSSVLSTVNVNSRQNTEELREETSGKARRALTFEKSSVSARELTAKDESVASDHSSKHPETSHSTNSETPPGAKEAKEGYTNSVNILKHFLKKPYLSDEKTFESRRRTLLSKQNSEGAESGEDDSEKSIVNGNKRSIVNVEDGSDLQEDKEVEDLCRAKGVPIPSTSETVKFRRSLDSAATLVFHNKTGLPLTSSPAPLRKGTCFDFDSTLNSIAAIRSAFRACDDVEEETDVIYKDVSTPTSSTPPATICSSAPTTVTCSNLLGSFEECVLNGRLEPVSTVQGFSAEIAASGAFCPKHITKSVTVFFYTLCDNDQISSPYMGHINLGKKGYHVPNQGTIQVTLFNPHGTVVKMFVVVYDLSDMPPNSKTFLRQRTLNMPVGASDTHEDAHQWLRYLIHLRFASSKSGKIYLHTDIRMLIFRKSDADAATLHKNSVPYELRSFTHGPTNPKFSPRK